MASLYVVDFKRALNFVEAQAELERANSDAALHSTLERVLPEN